MPRKRKSSLDKRATNAKFKKKSTKQDGNVIQLGAAQTKTIDTGSNGKQGSDNLVSQESETVSASDRANHTARAGDQARALVPHVVSANNNVDDTVQPMQLTPAEAVQRGSEPLSAAAGVNHTGRARDQKRKVPSSNCKVDDTIKPMDVTPAPISNTSGWLDLVRTYEAAIRQRADNVCISCDGLFYCSAVAGLNLETIADKFGGSFLTSVTPAKTHSSGLACATCLASIRSGKVPELCLSKGLAFSRCAGYIKGISRKDPGQADVKN